MPKNLQERIDQLQELLNAMYSAGDDLTTDAAHASRILTAIEDQLKRDDPNA